MSLKERLGLTQEPLYLMDGSAFVFRGFYAMQQMQRSDGFPTNALFIVTRILLKLLREEQPKYFGFILDGRGKNFRHETYPEYKANRSATPEGLVQQLDPIKEAVQLLGLRLEVSENCEADDCIASMAAKYKTERPVVIIGADKDLKQCLDENVYLWDPGAKQEKITSLKDFKEETGLEPAQWPDFQAIIGDSSDNIPGVPGVGPKTAEKIFAEYPTLEEIRDNYTNLKPALQKKFVEQLENMFVYRKLTTLRTGECANLSLDDFALGAIDAEKALGFMREYELRALMKDVAALAPAQVQPTQKRSVANEQLGLFGVPDSAPKATKVLVAQDVAELPDCAGKRVAIVPMEPIDGSAATAVAVDGKEYKHTGSLAALAGHMSKAACVVTPDVKALLATKNGWRSVPVNAWFDLGLALYLLSPEERDYSWRKLSRKADELDMSVDNPALLALAIADEFEQRVKGMQVWDLMHELEIPLTRVLADMEEVGIHIDHNAFESFLTEVQRELDRLTREIYKAAGGEFNIRSAQQLGQLLFETLGLKSKSKTKGGQASTSQAVLEKLAGEHPVIDMVLEYRKLEKLRSTYLEPMPKLADAKGRIHTTFNQLATATGRLSSSNPNLQNIPVRGEFGSRMRSCFTAQEGYKLVSADYSQVELRVLAHCSQDPTLLEAFKNDKDIHSSTASVLFDEPLDAISADQRRNAKTINFGLVYGMGPQKLSQELKISLAEAKAFIERYFAKLQQLKAFYEQVENEAKEQGYVTTLAGRRRQLPDIQSGNNQLQSQARRQAINTVIQGSAADIIKIAMLNVAHDEELKKLGAKLILQVHDELLLEVPESNADAAGKRLETIMSSVTLAGKTLDVPLKVDYGTGNGWHEAH